MIWLLLCWLGRSFCLYFTPKYPQVPTLIFMWYFYYFAGLFLSLGGFLSFMVTGSIAAIRFGVILGGVLLALSISSLRSYKRGQPPSPLALKGQTGKDHMLCVTKNAASKRFTKNRVTRIWKLNTHPLSFAIVSCQLALVHLKHCNADLFSRNCCII